MIIPLTEVEGNAIMFHVEDHKAISEALAEAISLLAVVAEETAVMVSERSVDPEFAYVKRNLAASIRQKTAALLATAAQFHTK